MNMPKMVRWYALATALGVAATAGVACRPSTTTTKEEPAVTVPGGFSKTEKRLQVALLTNGPASDWGFNYSHDQGLKYAQRALGDRIRSATIESVPETGDAERIIRRLIENGVGVVIAASFGYQDTTVKLAKEFPNVKFLQAWGFKPAANLGTYSSKMYEAWYVEGLVAGRMTSSNKIGVVAAHPIPPMRWQINAFALGARKVNPKAQVSVTFINHWFDPGLAAEATEALIGQGCDVVTGVLDNSVAVAQTAEKRKVFLIGHNADLSDFAPTAVLGGTRWLWGKLYEDELRRILDGAWTGTSGDVHGGFAEGYVGITSFGAAVPASVRQEAEAAVAKFRKGELQVYVGPLRDNAGKEVVPAGKTLTHDEIMAIGWAVDGVR